MHLHKQSLMTVERLLDGISRPRSMDVELVVEFHSTETSSFPSSACASQKPSEVNNKKSQVSAQDFCSTAKANLLNPTLPTPGVPLQVTTGKLVMTPTASPVSDCTITVLGNLRNPCVRCPEWTSTVTEFSAVGCHGCTSVYVVEPKWHCPELITTGGSYTADGTSTLTSTTSTLSSSDLTRET